MKKLLAIRILGVVFITLALSISLQGCAFAKNEQSDIEEIHISFKLDSRLLGPTYGGERWVPPPYGPIAYTGAYMLDARAYYIDPTGQEVGVDAKWIPADSELVTVSPSTGSRVTITIQELGETSLLVETSQGTSKTFYIKVTTQNENVRLVEISP